MLTLPLSDRYMLCNKSRPGYRWELSMTKLKKKKLIKKKSAPFLYTPDPYPDHVVYTIDITVPHVDTDGA